MPIKSPNYKGGPFHRVEEILPDQVIDTPVWCIQKVEAWRRKKTVFATCPNCLKVNRLDGRAIYHTGSFSGAGCFVCPSCHCPFWPHLKDWDPELRKIPPKRKRTTKRGAQDAQNTGVEQQVRHDVLDGGYARA